MLSPERRLSRVINNLANDPVEAYVGNIMAKFQKWQQNRIIEAIQVAGLDPREFDLVNEDAEFKIKHKSSESFLNVGDGPGLYGGRFVVGDAPSWAYEAYTWQALLSRVSNWIEDVKRDLEMPDLAELYKLKTGASRESEPTGWDRVDRTVTEIRSRLATAETEEQYQAVGLLCRETLISTSQAVYDPQLHPTLDGVAASPTDAKRMLEAYITIALGSAENEFVRKHTKASLDLAVSLQHKRMASFRDAALCVEATTSVVNLIAIMAGLRDPR
jgi:hypothetical protein